MAGKVTIILQALKGCIEAVRRCGLLDIDLCVAFTCIPSDTIQIMTCELQGWKRFFTSTALPGNGGPLRQPRGQTSVFYRWGSWTIVQCRACEVSHAVGSNRSTTFCPAFYISARAVSPVW